MAKLTPKMAAFAEEYLIDLNQTQAAIRAGYAPKHAAKIASELMQKPAVRDTVAQAMAARSARTGVNADRVVRELARVAFSQPGKVIRFEDATIIDDASEDDLAAIASVKVKTIPTEDGEGIEREVRMADKVKGLELLGRHLGMFNDKVMLTGTLPVQIVDDVPHTAVIGFHTDSNEEAGDGE
ncbi:MAG TPA: terminase small subunit [Clostridia bacterium]|nr:terminase small subunit [Clostridia bacterium]